MELGKFNLVSSFLVLDGVDIGIGIDLLEWKGMKTVNFMDLTMQINERRKNGR
jgi:hypothetical protein